jgi:hypothetical protein
MGFQTLSTADVTCLNEKCGRICGDLLFYKRQPYIGFFDTVDLGIADLEEAMIGCGLCRSDIKLIVALVSFDVEIPVIVCLCQTLDGNDVRFFPTGQRKRAVFVGENDVQTVADAQVCNRLVCCFVIDMSGIYDMFSFSSAQVFQCCHEFFKLCIDIGLHLFGF